MLYFLSRSSNNGTLTIDVTYELGTDPDLATVKTQNKVSLALPQLPPEVQRVGVTVKKVSTALIAAISLTSPDGRYDSLFLNNYAAINLVDKIGSIPGVGDARLAAQQTYGMRVWVNPDKMAKLKLTATDINNAIQEQNRQNPAGSIGQPPVNTGRDFQYPVNATGRLLDPQQFADIVVRALPDGSLLRLRDIGRVDLGAEDYTTYSAENGEPAAVLIVNLSPGANAVDAENRVKAFLEEAKKTFPAGIQYKIAYDATQFVRASIKDVALTLFEAVGLVILVVFVFLQDWRATLIPLVTVPVSILGAMALFPALGFTINMTSMFGLVLAIGIVVDDAIVVVEAVQLNIDRGMMPREATMHAMAEVSGPVVAIACILGAVFIPVAFLGGIAGLIYRQFALTIAASVLISAFSALSLSPALCAMILRPKRESSLQSRLFAWFNRSFTWTTHRYLGGVGWLLRKPVLTLMASGCVLRVRGCDCSVRCRRDFCRMRIRAWCCARSDCRMALRWSGRSRVTEQVDAIFRSIPGVTDATVLGGTDITTGTVNSNVATIFATLAPWEDRKKKSEQLAGIIAQAREKFRGVKDGVVFAFGMPPIQGLSNAGGFEFMLEDRTGGDTQQLADAAQLVLDAAAQRPELTNMNSTFRNNVPQYKVDLDTEKAQTLGIPVTDVYNALQTFLGGLYVNDFNRFSRTWRVTLQAEQEYRDNPDDISRFYVRTGNGDMVPLSTLVKVQRMTGPEVIYRYNRFRTAKIVGQNAIGYSSGQSANAMDQIGERNLPTGFAYEWTGTVFQQKLSEGKEGYLFGFAGVMVFLFLAALYESWSIPFAVVLAVPLGLFGALLAVYLRDYDYDIYTQIGIVTLIGLAAKNAILIVEYARLRRAEGMTIQDAAIEAAHLRLRPILMTSFAFILGVTPLLIAIGAGAASRRALGTTVFGGHDRGHAAGHFLCAGVVCGGGADCASPVGTAAGAGTDSGYGGGRPLRAVVAVCVRGSAGAATGGVRGGAELFAACGASASAISRGPGERSKRSRWPIPSGSICFTTTR